MMRKLFCLFTVCLLSISRSSTSTRHNSVKTLDCHFRSVFIAPPMNDLNTIDNDLNMAGADGAFTSLNSLTD